MFFFKTIVNKLNAFETFLVSHLGVEGARFAGGCQYEIQISEQCPAAIANTVLAVVLVNC